MWGWLPACPQLHMVCRPRPPCPPPHPALGRLVGCPVQDCDGAAWVLRARQAPQSQGAGAARIPAGPGQCLANAENPGSAISVQDRAPYTMTKVRVRSQAGLSWLLASKQNPAPKPRLCEALHMLACCLAGSTVCTPALTSSLAVHVHARSRYPRSPPPLCIGNATQLVSRPSTLCPARVVPKHAKHGWHRPGLSASHLSTGRKQRQ